MNKPDIKPVHGEPRPRDIKHSYSNIANAQTNLDYNPKVKLEKGLTELVKWYSEH